MATYLGLIADTGGRADFWTVARAHRVEPLAEEIPSHVLVDCWNGGWPAFDAPPRLARDLSRALATPCIAIVAQTAATVLDVQAFDAGVAVRALLHGDTGGWSRVEGAAEPWEAALLFAADDLVDDDLPEADLARYRAARGRGDPTEVLDLIQPDHLGPIERLCRHFGLDPRQPSARWRKPSLLSRIFGH